VTRGILVDMTRLKNPSRPPGARAYVEDLEAWERQTGLKVSPGDALFLLVIAPPNVPGSSGELVNPLAMF